MIPIAVDSQMRRIRVFLCLLLCLSLIVLLLGYVRVCGWFSSFFLISNKFCNYKSPSFTAFQSLAQARRSHYYLISNEFIAHFFSDYETILKREAIAQKKNTDEFQLLMSCS